MSFTYTFNTYVFFFFFFNDTATTEIYTLSLHDALPISQDKTPAPRIEWQVLPNERCASRSSPSRSEEHTSELQSLRHLVCRLLLEKKKKTISYIMLPKSYSYHEAACTTIHTSH